MSRVTCAKVSILMNGSPSPRFNIERGLKQGCPLSPLLLNLVVEALPRHLNQFESISWLNGIVIPCLVDRMTVLQFTDDIILFLNNTDGLSSTIHSCLTIFLVLTGLKINLSKNSIIGMKRDLAAATQITSDLCFRVGNFPFVCLGIPLGG